MFTGSGRRTRVMLVGVVTMIALAATGCGLLAPVMDGPDASPASGPSASSASAPVATPADRASALSTPSASPRRGLPSYPPATEPPCAIPGDAPTTVAGADGPRLTLARVAKAWRATSAGQSLGVTTGRVKAGANVPGLVLPSSVLDEPGLPWAELNIPEWNSTRTFVLSDQATAAAKLAAIRRMVAQPCSYQAGSTGQPLVLSLTVDAPDHVMATGVFGGLPFGQLFIRHGNTVTELTGVIDPDPSEAVAMVRDALAKA
ncbi:MAG: hypothetical protein QM779_00045 [Propionicimonas sp.]|uniref:hypothetical protein n=1 Tax=Propionicimonas sp. TaxID=1955623 RepID=UPI003D0F7D0B